jgi:hypothetical protein
MEGMDSEWRKLPESVRLWVAGSVGGRVLGFDPAPSRDGRAGEVAGVVRSIRGPVVIRAVPADSADAERYRFDARVTVALPSEVPAGELVRAGQADGWIVLIFEEPDGHEPAQPWRAEELARVTGLLDVLTSVLTPTPIEGLPTVRERIRASAWRRLASVGSMASVTTAHLTPNQTSPSHLASGHLTKWERDALPRLAEVESQWESLADGDTLLHGDVRPSSLRLSRRGQPTLLDWGSACIGPAWIDTALLLIEGDLGSLDADRLFLGTMRGRAAPPAEVDAFLVAIASQWRADAGSEAIPQSVRRRRAASALAATDWLRQRWGSS